MNSSLETSCIRKEYAGTVALDDVSVRFEGGKVSALLGKNGAGKSTLVKILAGTVQPTSGQILINGSPIELKSAGDSFRQGIATVYQELSLVPELTVAENILLGRMPHKRGFARMMLDWPAARNRRIKFSLKWAPIWMSREKSAAMGWLISRSSRLLRRCPSAQGADAR